MLTKILPLHWKRLSSPPHCWTARGLLPRLTTSERVRATKQTQRLHSNQQEVCCIWLRHDLFILMCLRDVDSFKHSGPLDCWQILGILCVLAASRTFLWFFFLSVGLFKIAPVFFPFSYDVKEVCSGILIIKYNSPGTIFQLPSVGNVKGLWAGSHTGLCLTTDGTSQL